LWRSIASVRAGPIRGLAVVRREHADVGPALAEPVVDAQVDELVAAEVVRRVEPGDREDADQPKTRSRTSSETSKFAWTSEMSSWSSRESMSLASFSAASSSSGVRTCGR
jgi:hypothetical protein